MSRNVLRTCTLIGALTALAACGEKSVGPTSALAPSAKPSPSATDPFNDQGNCLAADFKLTTANPDLSDPTKSCTANDIAVATSTLISYSTDGITYIPYSGQSIQCNKGDPIFVNLAATLGQTDNSARTDIGVWIATDGGNARTGACNHYNLVSPAFNTTVGGVSNTDNDACGDMTSASAAPSIPLGIISAVCQTSAKSADSLHIGSCLSWSQTDVACPSTDVVNFPGPLGFRVGTLPGTSSKCNCDGFNVPITVNQTAKLEVVKACSPSTDPGLFNLLIDADVKAPDAACGGTTGSLEVSAGTSAHPGASHAFSETQGTGTTLSNYNSTRTCVDRVGSAVRLVSAAGTSGSVTLQPDDDVICTITNTRKTGTIIIKKISSGGIGTFPFTSTGGLPSPASGTGAFSIITATQGVAVSATFSSVPTGSYSVTETLASLPAGFSLTALACTGGGNNTSTDLATAVSTIGLDDGETITCTYTNTKSAQLVVRKISTGGVGQFDFTSASAALPSPAVSGAFSLTTATQGVAASQTFSSLTPGTAYGVSETVPSDYTLTSRTCVETDAGAGGSVFPASGTTQPASITLAAGATITCTYTDTKKATLIINKVSTGGVGQFDFTSASGALPSPAVAGAFSLTTVTAGVAVGQTFSNLTPGTFGVSETVPSDYALTSRTCSETVAGAGGSAFPASGTTQPASITLAAGATITCTYYDKKNAQLRIVKSTDPDGDLTNFTFTPTNWNGGTTFTRADNQAAFASGFTLTPGATVYSTAETVPAGWALTGRACVLTGTATTKTSTNVTNGISLTLAAGEDVTCTFTNTELSTIIIEKELVGGGSQSFTFTRVKVGGGDLGDNGSPTLQNGGSSSSGKKLAAGTYTVCETNLAAGFSDPTATGFTLTGDGFGNYCTSVVLGVNDTKTVHFINKLPPPSGSTRTIGYWKNWSSCAQSSGGQYDKAIKNGTPQGTLDFYLTGAGVVSIYPIGNITGTPPLTCQQAVNMLAKNQINGSKAAGDPIYNMVAQLLGAKLNLAASAGSCAALNTALGQAQPLLVAVNFIGTGSYTKKLTVTQTNLANSLAGIFDSYNQGKLGGGCPTHI